ncbi:MAG: hypothetical protein U1E17_12745 [Geminicoccaceae bacterium]
MIDLHGLRPVEPLGGERIKGGQVVQEPHRRPAAVPALAASVRLVLGPIPTCSAASRCVSK